MQPAAAPLHLGGDLVAQHEVLGRGGAQQHDDVGLRRQLLQQREDRRGADAGADEQHAVARRRVSAVNAP